MKSAPVLEEAEGQLQEADKVGQKVWCWRCQRVAVDRRWRTTSPFPVRLLLLLGARRVDGLQK
jgi:hypothetical protein